MKCRGNLQVVFFLLLAAASSGCASTLPAPGAATADRAAHVGERAAAPTVTARGSTSRCATAVQADGAPGEFEVARLRNLNAFPVILDVVFTTGDMPDSEGYVPRDTRRLSLAAAGDPAAERMVVLSLSRVGAARVAAVERF